MSFCHSSLDKLKTFLDGSLVVKPNSAGEDCPDGFFFRVGPAIAELTHRGKKTAHSMHPKVSFEILTKRSPFQRALLLFPLVLACFALSTTVPAVTPAPDGGYPGNNTAEGTSALFSLTTGVGNTALGSQALFSDDIGNYNTGTGYHALFANTIGFYNTANGVQALFSNTTASYNTAHGFNSLYRNTTGTQNTATGVQALFSNTTGNYNTGYGVNSLYNNTTGISNTADGVRTLFSNTTGNYNTANGLNALYANTTGAQNTATGVQALFSNTTANFNTATGVNALYLNTTGPANTATGYEALFSNTTGHDNVAAGYKALYNNADGFSNMANGQQALYANTTGYQNTANGFQALFGNVDGFNNTAYGFQALAFNVSGTTNTAVGFNALGQSIGSGNTALGQAAGFNLTTGNNNIDIGNQGVAGESGTIRIGDTQTATYIAGIFGQSVDPAGASVSVDSAGKLGTVLSSRRFKDGIKPMDQASEVILELKPVTFHYKSDKKNTPCFGLIAEDVAAVNPDLVVRDKNGEILSVRYEQINAMLLNEFLKEHRTVQDLKSTVAKQEALIAQQQQGMTILTAELKEQAAQIQRVSAQLEVTRPAPQVVENQR